MDRIVLRLDPGRLKNSDTDLRYVLPDLICERAGGRLTDDGWSYEGDPPFMVMWLRTEDINAALPFVLDVVENVRVMENDLRQACVVAVQRDGGCEVMYPAGFVGRFDPWAS